MWARLSSNFTDTQLYKLKYKGQDFQKWLMYLGAQHESPKRGLNCRNCWALALQRKGHFWRLWPNLVNQSVPFYLWYNHQCLAVKRRELSHWFNDKNHQNIFTLLKTKHSENQTRNFSMCDLQTNHIKLPPPQETTNRKNKQLFITNQCQHKMLVFYKERVYSNTFTPSFNAKQNHWGGRML